MSYTYLFIGDYSEGAHPRILECLSHNNLKQEANYGADSFCKEAEKLIQKKIENPSAKVYFVTTSTQANIVALVAMLKPYESVISTNLGHINCRETGAIEAAGHKINTVSSIDGKVTPASAQEVLNACPDSHFVKPKVVYISQTTELGTVYTRKELEKLSEFCKQNNLYLYIDGARLGHALMASNADCNFCDIAKFSDIFSIGGTKNGGLIGEAIVICEPHLQENFNYYLRQRGALLGKSRVIGAQFVEFFKDNLYLDNAKYANDMAEKLTVGIKKQGYNFLIPCTSNLLFPIFPNVVIKKLKQKYGFNILSEADSDEKNSITRLVTSWYTPESIVNQFLHDLRTI